MLRMVFRHVAVTDAAHCCCLVGVWRRADRCDQDDLPFPVTSWMVQKSDGKARAARYAYGMVQ